MRETLTVVSGTGSVFERWIRAPQWIDLWLRTKLYDGQFDWAKALVDSRLESFGMGVLAYYLVNPGASLLRVALVGLASMWLRVLPALYSVFAAIVTFVIARIGGFDTHRQRIALGSTIGLFALLVLLLIVGNFFGMGQSSFTGILMLPYAILVVLPIYAAAVLAANHFELSMAGISQTDGGGNSLKTLFGVEAALVVIVAAFAIVDGSSMIGVLGATATALTGLWLRPQKLNDGKPVPKFGAKVSTWIQNASAPKFYFVFFAFLATWTVLLLTGLRELG